MNSLNRNFKKFFLIGFVLFCFSSIFSKNVFFQWRELDASSYFEENGSTYIDLEVIAKHANRSIEVFNSTLIYIRGEKWNVFIFPQNSLAILNSSESLSFYPNDLKIKNGKIFLTSELMAKVMNLELISNDMSIYLNIPLARVTSITTIIQKTDARIIIELSSTPEEIGVYPLVNRSGYLLKIRGAEVADSYIYEEYKNKISFIKAYHYSPTEVWIQIKLNNTAELNEIFEDNRIILDLTFEENISLPVLVLDPGHGGIDSGAVGPTKLFEKDITLAVAKKVQELLNQYSINVYLTRTSDVYVDLHDRAMFSNEKGADLFISLHMNDYPSDKTVSGSEVYYFDFSENAYARRIAYRENLDMNVDKNIIQTWVSDKGNSLKQSENFAKILGSYINGNGIRFRGVYKDEFAVLAYTRCPAVLFEMEFISNPEVEKKFSSEQYINTFAEIIKNAVIEYFNLK